MTVEVGDLTWREKGAALKRVASFRPAFTVGLIVFGAGAALLEGIGLSFIYPILEIAQGEISDPDDPIMQAFVTAYAVVDVPLSLGYLIIGISLIMVFRYSATFMADWLRAMLRYSFEKSMRDRTFNAALNARIDYYDEAGSDDILNAIITETRYAGKVIRYGVRTLQNTFLAFVYLSIMLYIAPLLTVVAICLLVAITIFIRNIIEPAVNVGGRVATANERVQQAVQDGTQGIRDVKLFSMGEEVYQSFRTSLERYASQSVRLARNKAGVKNAYNLAAAITLFILIYVGLSFTELSLAGLGVFLFAMFQLAPYASKINSDFYKMEGNLPHIVRTYAFLDELESCTEDHGDRPLDSLETVAFEDVSFGYTSDNGHVLDGIDFTVDHGDFVAFVGQSGAGKSTIVSLLVRMYDTDSGQITGDDIPIEEYALEQWRECIAVVRQQPFVFNDTLANNVTIGNRNASRERVKEVCRIAKVDEFAQDLPDGYDSLLGDDGVRLSGGQRQRVALARALLKDADFLVLDEATSDLDSNLEREVQQNIEAMNRDYGIITIAHRLSTVENADVIFTVQDGQITESGTHSELVGKNGKYAELYSIQSAT